MLGLLQLNKQTNTKKTIMKLLQKKPFIFRNEVLGFNYIFDCDIEIYLSTSGEIEDYSGCGYEQAKKLIESNK